MLSSAHCLNECIMLWELPLSCVQESHGKYMHVVTADKGVL